MKQMLQWRGITRQGMHQAWRRLGEQESRVTKTLELAAQVRKEHPGMGCRDMYYLYPQRFPAGRDWTEQVLLAFGYGKYKMQSFTRAGVYHLQDLIAGKTVTGPNQVWQTDITYVWAAKRWHYVSFLVDVFDRSVVDFMCTTSLRMGPQIQLVTAAIGRLSATERKNLIVHTDRGVQYGPQFTQALNKHGVAHSMAHYAWQNAYCERFHRTIKNGYLKFYKLDSIEALQQGVARAVKLYNTQKPHSSLPSRLAPLAFNKAFKDNKYPGYTETIWAEQQNKYIETTTKNVNVY